MRTFGRLVVVGGLLLGLVIAAAGCNGGGTADGNAISAKQARLFEDENYRLSEQIKGLEKEIADLNTARVAEQKQWMEQEEANGTAMSFFVSQMAEKDAEIEKLQHKIAELEKELAEAKKM